MTKHVDRSMYGFIVPGSANPALFFEEATRDRDMPARAKPFDFIIRVPVPMDPLPRALGSVIKANTRFGDMVVVRGAYGNWLGSDGASNYNLGDMDIEAWEPYVPENIPEVAAIPLSDYVDKVDYEELAKELAPILWQPGAYSFTEELVRKRQEMEQRARKVVETFVSVVETIEALETTEEEKDDGLDDLF